MKQIKKLNKLLLIAGLLVLINNPWQAAASFSFTAIPADPNLINQNKFILEARPGDQIEEKLYVENQSTEPMKLKLYPVDGQINEEGKFTGKNSDQQQMHIGQWAKIEKQEINLNPGEGQVVNCTIIIPDETALGDFFGGLAVENIPADNDQTLQINSRIIVRVDLKVTENPNPPAKLYPEKPFWQKINKTYLTIAGLLFIFSLVGLYLTSRKEKLSKRAKPYHDD